MDTMKTMRELCAEELMFESFLVLKGFPFSLNNPIVDLVTFDDVAQVQGLDKQAFLDEFVRYRDGEISADSIERAQVNPMAAGAAPASAE